MGYYTSSEVAVHFCEYGLHKTKLSISKFSILALLGGAFIAFGGLLTIIVAGGMPEVMAGNPGLVRLTAGMLFPIGLIMVSVAGADLFTSDCAGLTIPYLEKKINLTAVFKVLILSYFFNFFGAQLVAYIFTHQTGLVAGEPYKSYLFDYTEHKVHQDWVTVFIKGIGANWLVCLGTWMGFAGKDIIGKAIGIWIPVMLFVTLGFEHSIANMFFVPAAIYSGADISWGTFIINNLIPATLGNIIGGVLFVGSAYWYVFLKK